MANDDHLKKTLKKLISLANRAVKLRKKTNGSYNGKFLQQEFKKIIRTNANKDDKFYVHFIAVLKNLASSYSVSRTVDFKKIDSKLCDFLLKNIKTFNMFRQDSQIKSNLFKILFDQRCAAKGSKRTVSFFSKCAYYLTKQNFPIYDIHANNGLNALFNLHLKNKKIIKYKDKYKNFFYNYRVLLDLIKDNKLKNKFKNDNPIDSIDAFFWLYGIMSNTNENKLWYSQTCGYIGSTCFQKWYKDARNFICRPTVSQQKAHSA